MMNKLLKISLALIMLITLVGCQTVDESDVSIVLNPGVDTVEINSEFIDAGATSRAYSFKVENEVIFNDVDITTVGTYQIIYQVDYKNVIKTITRVVNVVDETEPYGTLNPGIDTIKVGTAWVDASVNVGDNSLDEVIITVSGTVNINIEGEYIITYILVDTSGNQTYIERYVFVIE